MFKGGDCTSWLGMVLCLAVLWLTGCGKPKTAKLDPHSAEGVLVQLVDQGRLLNEALARQDYAYLHDFGFYFNGLAQAFFGKLEDDQRAKLRGQLDQLISLSSQLDRAAGGRRAEATEATVQKLVAVLQETERQYREMKKR